MGRGGGGVATYSAAELVELGETETFGMFDDHDGGIADINADFYDRGGD